MAASRQPGIGVGVDESPGARDAVVLARSLARATGAWLMMVHAAFQPAEEELLGGHEVAEGHRRRGWTLLSETRDALAPDAEIEVRSDVFVWRALRHVVHFMHADMLVVGSSHDTPEGRVGLGGHVADLQQHLERPLAIAPRGYADRPARPIERVGVGFDGGDRAEAAVQVAASIASAAGACLVVRGVLPERVPAGPRGQDALEHRLVAFAPDIRATTEVELPSGNPVDGLLELSGEVDLLVIGSGRGAHHGRVLVGRTGLALLERARSPLVVAPAPNHAERVTTAHPART
jgi:nucleotide-binding universal stress UspA family protein